VEEQEELFSLFGHTPQGPGPGLGGGSSLLQRCRLKCSHWGWPEGSEHLGGQKADARERSEENLPAQLCRAGPVAQDGVQRWTGSLTGLGWCGPAVQR
jgi:hypothetical protein